MALYSATERGSFERCERGWRLSSKNGQHLGPIIPPIYLSVGTMVHNGAKSWLLNNPPDTSYEGHVLLAAERLIDKAKARYLKQTGREMAPLEDQELYNAVHYAQTMARNYQIRWGSPIPDGFRLVAPEQHTQVPVPGTEHECETCLGSGEYLGVGPGVECGACRGSGIQLHLLDMRFDGIIVDKLGRLHILEHKTYSSKPNEQALRYNDQFLAYMWGARQLGIGAVVGLAYDGLWRRDSVPKGKTFEDLFFRYEHIRSEAEFEEFGRLLPYQLNDMWAKRPAVRPLETLPINRRWMGCFDCSFDDDRKSGKLGLCGAISRNEVALREILLRTRYTERDDDTEDDDDAAD